jgi:hypothetical protein
MNVMKNQREVSKLDFKTHPPNKHKAAGGKWKSGKSSNNLPAAFSSLTPFRYYRTFSLINVLMYVIGTYLYNTIDLSLNIAKL